MLLGLTALPYWLPYYVVTVAGPMALLAGIGLAQSLPAPSRGARAAWAAILCGAVIFAAQTWRSKRQGMIPTPCRRAGCRRFMPRADARYAYELGQQPDFYAAGGFVPASGIQFFLGAAGNAG